MQVTVDSTSALERRVRIELPGDQIETEVDSRLKSFGRTAKIKGFRPGKVPAKVVRQRYGKQGRTSSQKNSHVLKGSNNIRTSATNRAGIRMLTAFSMPPCSPRELM